MTMEDRRWGDNGCAEEKPTHPSLRPPSHGYPPHEASPTSWILLDLHAYIADRENATSAWSKTSNGKAIRVTFCTAPPPLVSYICVWCPDAEISVEPTVEASGSDLVLLCVSLRGSRRPQQRNHVVDYFVYKATGSKGPSLRLLQDPNPCVSDRYNIALLAHRDVGKAHAEISDDDFYIAALNHDKRSRLQDFRLWIFDSQDGKWRSRPFSLDSVYCHITCKVIALGEGGLLGFVDPWRGIVVCDVFGRRPEHFLPLPPDLVRLDKFRDEPLLSRDIAFVRGRLSVVELRGIIIQGINSWKVGHPELGHPEQRSACKVHLQATPAAGHQLAALVPPLLWHGLGSGSWGPPPSGHPCLVVAAQAPARLPSSDKGPPWQWRIHRVLA